MSPADIYAYRHNCPGDNYGAWECPGGHFAGGTTMPTTPVDLEK